MTPSVLVFTLVALVMLKVIFGLYAGESYVCPVCGSRDADEHSDACPWKR